MDVTERLVRAAGRGLALTTLVEFTERPATGTRVFYVPNRLWRVEVPQCFAKVELLPPSGTCSQGVAEGALWRLMSGGTELHDLPAGSMPRWWSTCAPVGLPLMVRTAWEPLVRLAAAGRFKSAWHAYRQGTGWRRAQKPDPAVGLDAVGCTPVRGVVCRRHRWPPARAGGARGP